MQWLGRAGNKGDGAAELKCNPRHRRPRRRPAPAIATLLSQPESAKRVGKKVTLHYVAPRRDTSLSSLARTG